MAERKGNQQKVPYQKDLWGGEGHQALPPGGRRKKNPAVPGKIDEAQVTQGSLFTEDVQPGKVAPLTSVNTSQPNVLQSDMFSHVSKQAVTPEPGATVVKRGETAHGETQAAVAPTISQLPVDLEVVIPEDLQLLVTHIPRYLLPPEHQHVGVMHLIPTRFFILGYDEKQYRHQVAGIILESEDGTDRQPLLYHGVPHTFDRAIQQIREVAKKQGYLHEDGSLNSDALALSTLPTPFTDNAQASQKAFVAAYDTSQQAMAGEKAQIKPLEPMPFETLENSNAFMAHAVTVIPINSEREDIESINRQRITTPYFIVSVFTPPRGTRHIPGRVLETEGEGGQIQQLFPMLARHGFMQFTTEVLQEIARQTQTRSGRVDTKRLQHVLGNNRELTPEQEQELTTLLNEFVLSSLYPNPEDNLPFPLRKLIKVTKPYKMKAAEREMYVIATPLCIVAIPDPRHKEIVWYKAGVVTERDGVTKRQTKMTWLNEQATQTVDEPYRLLAVYIQEHGLTEADVAPLTDIPLPLPKETPPPPTREELAEEPLLAILSRDEIFHDPFEVTIEDAEENGFPMLRRDVTSHIWWLEFPYDTRENEALDSALKENGWKWGGYHQQMYNPKSYAKVPDGLYYANAGPCSYAQERAGRYETRREKAVQHSNAYYAKFNSMISIIPFGQPMMPDHYSYRRDSNYRRKIGKQIEKASEYYRKAQWLEERAEGSRNEQEYRQTGYAMAEREKRLQADVRSLRRGYNELKGQTKTWDGEILTADARERGLEHYRREMTITAYEMLFLREGIREKGGLAIATEEVKPETGALLLIKGRVMLAGKITKANKTNIAVIDFGVPGHSETGWKGHAPFTSFQRVLMTAEEVRLAIEEGKTPYDLTKEWKERLRQEGR
jgi:hypothetical protein